MSAKIKSITNPRLSLKVLRAEDIRRIHETTLEIVETIGVKFPSPRALDIWKAGLENGLSTFMASAVMSDMLLGVGLLNGSTTWSFEQMIMDCEIFGIVRKTMEGIPVDAETPALEPRLEAELRKIILSAGV